MYSDIWIAEKSLTIISFDLFFYKKMMKCQRRANLERLLVATALMSDKCAKTIEK